MKPSTRARIKCATVLTVFTVLGVGPIPLTSTLGLLLVIFLPAWFKKLVDDLYTDKE
ncbi:hypothetical protein [Methylobacter sp. YRD-M1]|uniref:hypothetical protein n=1 Tax=Methylobacter sp. YRD-M1 TaxID=2911520 RepID=UPI00227A94FC|nr:hypothetical protein [Methylobacter sp. YRD-M1]WAK03878.1 hypothetical protein LZ558_08860 [Methylobacter sp. YRD-M1]